MIAIPRRLTGNPHPKLVLRPMPNPVPRLMKNIITPNTAVMKSENLTHLILNLMAERAAAEVSIKPARDIPGLTNQSVSTKTPSS